jgi:hypothetical protein
MASNLVPTKVVPINSNATVATSQTTTGTSYTDLATGGPSVTVDTGTRAMVIVTATIANNTASAYSYMDYAVSGATTRSASDSTAATVRQTGATSGQNQEIRLSSASIVTLTAGRNTFTSKYRVSGGTGTFINREIIVINLQ